MLIDIDTDATRAVAHELESIREEIEAAIGDASITIVTPGFLIGWGASEFTNSMRGVCRQLSSQVGNLGGNLAAVASHVVATEGRAVHRSQRMAHEPMPETDWGQIGPTTGSN